MLVVVIKSWLYDPGFHLTLGILLAHIKGLFGQKFSLCAVSLLYSLWRAPQYIFINIYKTLTSSKKTVEKYDFWEKQSLPVMVKQLLLF